MNKPLQDTFWTRLKLLFRGIVFYNTIYWRRASDGLNPPKLSPVEREAYAPPRDLEVIKPRMKPRARLDSAERQRLVDQLARLRGTVPPSIAAQLAAAQQPLVTSSPPSPAAEPIRGPALPPVSAPVRSYEPAPPVEAVLRKRRRRRSGF